MGHFVAWVLPLLCVYVLLLITSVWCVVCLCSNHLGLEVADDATVWLCSCCVLRICLHFLQGACYDVSGCSSEWYCMFLHCELIAWWSSQTSTPLKGWLSLEMGILFWKGQVGPMISMSCIILLGAPWGQHLPSQCWEVHVGFIYWWNHFTRLSPEEDCDNAGKVSSRWCHDSIA